MAEGAPQSNNIGPDKSREGNEKIDLRILIADDNENIRKLLGDILGEEYSSIESVKNGQDLVDRLDSGQIFDFIISDNDMPEMTGPEAIKKIREVNQNIPIIMLTGGVDQKTKEEVEALDVVCLSKPPNIKKLIATIESMRLKQK